MDKANFENQLKLFHTQQERIDFDNEIYKIYKKNISNGFCMFDGCSRRAVDSHAISKLSSLAHIVDKNNKLLSFCPKRTADDKELLIKEVGYNKATAFKGFCVEHEKLFKNIDNYVSADLKCPNFADLECPDFADRQ